MDGCKRRDERILVSALPSLLALLLVTVPVVVATTTTTATTAAPAPTTTPSALKSIPVVVAVALVLPVVRLAIPALVVATPATTAAAAAASPLLALEECGAPTRAGLENALLDLPVLLLQVIDLLHDEEIAALPGRLGVQVDEGVGELRRLKLDKDGALEEILLGAPELDQLDGAKGNEEGLDVELGRLSFLSKALDVDGGVEARLLGDGG